MSNKLKVNYNTKKYYFLIFLIVLIYYGYLYSIIDITSQKNFFISFSIPSDPLYISLINNFFQFINSGLAFPYIMFVNEALIINFLKFDYVWFSLIVYNFLLILIFLIFFEKIYSKNNKFKISIILFIISITLSDHSFFNDRYPRPLFNSLFILTVFFINIGIQSNILKLDNKILSIVFGLSCSLSLQTAPWTASFLIPMTFICFYKKYKDLFLNKYFIFTFIVFLVPSIIVYLYNLKIDSYHSKYIGVKEIENNIFFLKSYYFDLIKKNYFLGYKTNLIFLFLILTTISSIILKDLKILIIYIIPILLAPLLFILIGKSVLDFHLYQMANNYAFLILLHSYLKLFVFLINKNFFLKKEIFNIFFFIFHTFLFVWTFNQIDEHQIKFRSEYIYNNYKNEFEKLDQLSNNCKLFTNDTYILNYWKSFNKGDDFPNLGWWTNKSFLQTEEDLTKIYWSTKDLIPLNEERLKEIILIIHNNAYLNKNSNDKKDFNLNRVYNNILSSEPNGDEKKYNIIWNYNLNDTPKVKFLNVC